MILVEKVRALESLAVCNSSSSFSNYCECRFVGFNDSL